jgi:integrase
MLLFAGLRIGEAQALRWRDLDLLRGTIRVRQAKTDAGVRIVHMLPILRRELGQYRNHVSAAPSQLVFSTARGHPLGASNIRIRMLARAVEQANANLESRGQQPLPAGLTPHSLRCTFASLLFALSEPPTYVMSQMGHTTPVLTLAIYAREMNRRDGERQRLKALVAGGSARVASAAHSSTASSLATRITPRHGTTLEIRLTEQSTELEAALR